MHARSQLAFFCAGVVLAWSSAIAPAVAQSGSETPQATASPLVTATPVASETPVANASALPSPSTSASASASASGSATPVVTPPAGALRLTREFVAVAPRQIVAVGVDGASGAVGVRASSQAILARYDATSSSVIVTGISLGTATVTVSDAAGDQVTLPVSVLPAAGVVPGDVTVSLGGVVSPQFALAKIDAAIARGAQVQTGANVSVRGVTIANALHPGDSLEASARVGVTAGNAFADQTGTTAVHLSVEALDRIEPAFLFYSDDPERLGSDGDGVLYRGTIDANDPARLYAYHVSDTAGRKLYLVLTTTAPAASVQLLGYAAGPADAFGYVGHVSTLQYLLERASQESSIVDVGADTPYVQQLGYRALTPGELVAAIFDLRVTSGGPVNVEVLAASGSTDPIERAGEPEKAGDGHGRRGVFAMSGVPPFAFAYAAGDPEPTPLSIGQPVIPNLRTGGRALGGDYGALRNVDVQLTNPAATPQSVYLYEQPLGGAATTTIWFTSDARPIEIPCVKIAANRYLVKAFDLGPGETRDVTGEYMTDGSASFPLAFGLTMASPSPPPGPYSPDACNPKTPPVSPSPSAIPSAIPSALPSGPPAPVASPEAPSPAPSVAP